MSPKTLATVFNNCLRPQGIEEDLKRTAPRKDNDISTLSSEAPNRNISPAPGGSQKKVLLVEDNAVNLKVRGIYPWGLVATANTQTTDHRNLCQEHWIGIWNSHKRTRSL